MSLRFRSIKQDNQRGDATVYYVTIIIEKWGCLAHSHPDSLDEVDGLEVADALDKLGIIAEAVSPILRHPLAHRPQPGVVPAPALIL